MNGIRKNMAAALMMAALAWTTVASANQSSFADETRRCLQCHSQPGPVLTFLSKETMPATIDAASFRASVHGSLSCPSCHNDFSEGRHPERTFKSREQYRIKSSIVCRRCHSDQQIMRRNVHERVLQEETQGKPVLCVNCHGSHTIARISGTASSANEEQYCMKCHAGQPSMHFENGETRKLTVDLASLKESAHMKLSCSDCHYGFSSDEHPRRHFRTDRDFKLASSENCRRCHFDKYTKTLEGIHYTLLSQGNLNAPVCTDCHGSHRISPMGKERASSAKRCQRCHSREYETYAKSVHGDALFNERNQDVPVCVDCHTAHTIQDPFSLDYREQIPQMCSNCHAKKEIVGKYGLSTDVVKTYLSDFHGVTLGLYKKQKAANDVSGRPIAVCTDCHGTHNISSTTGPDATVVKKNLVRRCQKCHTQANERFPDAWLSHYEPTFARTPLVFVIGWGYKIFIPLMLIGLVLQILLHIWRYAINR